MGRAFEQADLVIAATNPGPAFAADASMSNKDKSFVDVAAASPAARYALRGVLAASRVATTALPALPSQILDLAGRFFPGLINMGALTIISNIYGNPAVSIPAGLVDGLPVGMQVLTRHHRDALLFDRRAHAAVAAGGAGVGQRSYGVKSISG
jgi:hypothetical protein